MSKFKYHFAKWNSPLGRLIFIGPAQKNKPRHYIFVQNCLFSLFYRVFRVCFDLSRNLQPQNVDETRSFAQVPVRQGGALQDGPKPPRALCVPAVPRMLVCGGVHSWLETDKGAKRYHDVKYMIYPIELCILFCVSWMSICQEVKSKIYARYIFHVFCQSLVGLFGKWFWDAWARQKIVGFWSMALRK